MILVTITVIVVTLIAICTAFTRPRTRKVTVVYVTDGDTFIVLDNRKQDTVRIWGIDAPESSQEYGEKATDVLKGMISGKEVTLIPKGKDKYGRTVARVFQGSTDVGLEMLRRGYAWYLEDYCRYPDYEKATIVAKANGKGLWASRNPVNPRYYRMQHKEEK